MKIINSFVNKYVVNATLAQKIFYALGEGIFIAAMSRNRAYCLPAILITSLYHLAVPLIQQTFTKKGEKPTYQVKFAVNVIATTAEIFFFRRFNVIATIGTLILLAKTTFYQFFILPQQHQVERSNYQKSLLELINRPGNTNEQIEQRAFAIQQLSEIVYLSHPKDIREKAAKFLAKIPNTFPLTAAEWTIIFSDIVKMSDAQFEEAEKNVDILKYCKNQETLSTLISEAPPASWKYVIRILHGIGDHNNLLSILQAILREINELEEKDQISIIELLSHRKTQDSSYYHSFFSIWTQRLKKVPGNTPEQRNSNRFDVMRIVYKIDNGLWLSLDQYFKLIGEFNKKLSTLKFEEQQSLLEGIYQFFCLPMANKYFCFAAVQSFLTNRLGTRLWLSPTLSLETRRIAGDGIKKLIDNRKEICPDLALWLLGELTKYPQLPDLLLKHFRSFALHEGLIESVLMLLADCDRQGKTFEEAVRELESILAVYKYKVRKKQLGDFCSRISAYLRLSLDDRRLYKIMETYPHTKHLTPGIALSLSDLVDTFEISSLEQKQWIHQFLASTQTDQWKEIVEKCIQPNIDVGRLDQAAVNVSFLTYRLSLFNKI